MSERDQVTIEHLEIRFDVVGDSEEETFAQLFTKYVDLWGRAQEEQQLRRRRAEADRCLGDREASP